ncbi:hypothetical protein KQX54_012746 [Cotesia glomerata]|uniref:Uncharacterized protein n=1 Tax=Cotesia glomerata TaxID=32391 RepID=A0AAV7IMB0_COTGL|nr:hypothetical protein KQX54_012746 [Cotesia glomerata]
MLNRQPGDGMLRMELRYDGSTCGWSRLIGGKMYLHEPCAPWNKDTVIDYWGKPQKNPGQPRLDSPKSNIEFIVLIVTLAIVPIVALDIFLAIWVIVTLIMCSWSRGTSWSLSR